MALRRSKTAAADDANDAPTPLDRLIALREDITGTSASTDLIDILIDQMGGDHTQVVSKDNRQPDIADDVEVDAEGGPAPVDEP